jgi:hypothetical protein
MIYIYIYIYIYINDMFDTFLAMTCPFIGSAFCECSSEVLCAPILVNYFVRVF